MFPVVGVRGHASIHWMSKRTLSCWFSIVFLRETSDWTRAMFTRWNVHTRVTTIWLMQQGPWWWKPYCRWGWGHLNLVMESFFFNAIIYHVCPVQLSFKSKKLKNEPNSIPLIVILTNQFRWGQLGRGLKTLLLLGFKFIKIKIIFAWMWTCAVHLKKYHMSQNHVYTLHDEQKNLPVPFPAVATTTKSRKQPRADKLRSDKLSTLGEAQIFLLWT